MWSEMAANLDLNDKLIKRGVLVSWHGYRGQVLRVRTGRCLVRIPGNALGKWLDCSTVQVVS